MSTSSSKYFRNINLNNAQVYGKTKWLDPGDYTLEVLEAQFYESSRHRGRVYFQVFFEVIASNNPDFAIGSRCGWQTNLSNDEVAANNIKGFLMGCLEGVKGDDITNELATKLIDDKALDGVTVEADAFHITTQAGTPFTVVNWAIPGANRAGRSDSAKSDVAPAPS